MLHFHEVRQCRELIQVTHCHQLVNINPEVIILSVFDFTQVVGLHLSCVIVVTWSSLTWYKGRVYVYVLFQIWMCPPWSGSFETTGNSGGVRSNHDDGDLQVGDLERCQSFRLGIPIVPSVELVMFKFPLVVNGLKSEIFAFRVVLNATYVPRHKARWYTI